MKRIDSRHLLHFLLLLIILLIGASLVLSFGHDRPLQIVFVIATSSAYVLWGVIHHLKNHDLHPRILLEYLAIAALGSTILITLILKA